MSYKTRSQTARTTINTVASGSAANTSYVTIIAEESDDEGRVCTGDGVVQDLRDQLAVAQAGIVERDEKIGKLINRIATLETLVSGKDAIVAELTDALRSLERCVMHRDAGMQTDAGEVATQALPLACLSQNKNRLSVIRRSSVNRESVTSRRSRVLLLADDHGRGAAGIVRESLGSGFDTTSIFKPGATMEQVLRNVGSLASDFSRDDFVVVVAGMNNVLDTYQTNFKSINSRLLQLKHTNVIITSVPYTRSNRLLNDAIYNFNCRLYDNMHRIKKDIMYVDVNNVILPETNGSNFKPNINTFVNFENIVQVKYSDSLSQPDQNSCCSSSLSVGSDAPVNTSKNITTFVSSEAGTHVSCDASFSQTGWDVCGSSSSSITDNSVGGGEGVDLQHVLSETVANPESQLFRD